MSFIHPTPSVIITADRQHKEFNARLFKFYEEWLNNRKQNSKLLERLFIDFMKYLSLDIFRWGLDHNAKKTPSIKKWKPNGSHPRQ